MRDNTRNSPSTPLPDPGPSSEAVLMWLETDVSSARLGFGFVVPIDSIGLATSSLMGWGRLIGAKRVRMSLLGESFVTDTKIFSCKPLERLMPLTLPVKPLRTANEDDSVSR